MRLVPPQVVVENEGTRRFIERMLNWKFTQALSAMPSTVSAETSCTVEALSAVFGDVGGFDGEMGMVVTAAVASVIGCVEEE